MRVLGCGSACVVLILLLQQFQAKALPIYWGNPNRVGDGCEIPQQGYKFHKDPVLDSNASLEVFDLEGQSVTSFESGATYNLKLTFPERSRSFILSSEGELESELAYENEQADLCVSQNISRVTLNLGLKEAQLRWSAPSDDSVVSVNFRVVRATFFASPYFVSEFTISRGDNS
uniref:Reelin domain-containing protein n=1 Tax=Tetraselmis sp. GSL018 TaxID=582737 RepID=A0A061S7Q3_9CHLO|eukprot:CAMPEP_0177600508 /NCGR_PEP_ID=MMETSP0419_2-20121207/13670_1 /TAXON_ID=582737 /ORGANISM="Tetraselmis sp., Strain GSL018" /LENGTH=173 /DNA_ID=CAMNT_0019093525 /DNA_START=186 /DNA_END=707 /DNA_ORIENTATION=-